MRMLIRVKLPTAAYNKAASTGVLGKVWAAVFEECPPEATYYLEEDGERAVYIFTNVVSPEQIALLALPLYEHFEARVSFTPVMVFSDIEAALGRKPV